MISEFSKILRKFGLEHWNRYYGIYKGFVSDNDDPETRGRLKLKVPQVYGDSTYGKWALPKGMYSGKDIGMYFLPNVDDPVWVSFENGDPRYPVWEYGWWGSDSAPEDSSVDLKILQTTSGHRIEFDDTKDEEKIRIIDKHGHIITLNSEGVSIESDNVSLGSLDNSEEPAVKGDTAVALLNEFIEDVGRIGVIKTSSGVTDTISTSPLWNGLVQKWKNKWKEFNSEVVTLD